MLKFLLCYSLFLFCNGYETRTSMAHKGKLFIHTLHSASMFNRSVDVDWKVSLKNHGALPQWLHLVESRYPAIAYLIGTPVTAERQVTVEVVARRRDTFSTQLHYLIITFSDNDLFNGKTVQTIDIAIKNVDVEKLLNDRSGMIGRLEQAVKDTFRGRNVRPYIFNIAPLNPIDKTRLFRNNDNGIDLTIHISPRKLQRHEIARRGCMLTVGSQRGFYAQTATLVDNLQRNPSFCKRNSQITINKYFMPNFVVDWCLTRLQNRSFVDDSDSSEEVLIEKAENLEPLPEQPPRELGEADGRLSFWHSVLIFPLIAVLCIVLVLVLSLIFFGKREGQQWRDYKTPKEQLEEFVSVRESQRHLRELSVQRQLLLMSNDRDQSQAPSGIHSFLQPKARPIRSMSGSARFSKSHSKLNENTTAVDETVELLPEQTLGRQTVAEAARQCGSSLHLYRNPLESESDAESDDSLDHSPQRQ